MGKYKIWTRDAAPLIYEQKPEINLDIVEAKQGYYLGVVFPVLKSRNSAARRAGDDHRQTQEGETVAEDATDTVDDADESGEEMPVAEGTELDVEVDEAVNPEGETWGASAFLQVNWLDVDYGILPVTEARALEMLVESLVSVAVATEKWMDKTYGEK